MASPDPVPDPLEDLVAECLRRRSVDGVMPVDELCARHPPLAEALRARLRALHDTGMAVRSPVPPPTADSSPQQIGPYRILDRLGEGGMGTVWLAEQKTPVRRRVALKVIKPGMDSRQVLARFEAERQALAMMEHDHIAKVFDAGTTERGQPFFVMEYVKGVPITDHCDTKRLSTRERLRLFQQVCDAVQHAHHKGVIHRDLKPSNILVTEHEGHANAKVIDFGLARATDHRLVEATIFTEHGQMLGTPEYMSPEQAEMTSAEVDTRTDVYSLGVLLYELLVGQLPFSGPELRQAGLLELRRKIREDEPPRPSTRLSSLGEGSATTAQRRQTTTEVLLRELRGDLDWIVMRAMEKDRKRRYQTPRELEQEIGRFLADEPVLAGPPGAAYRLKKFAGKHRGKLVAAGLLLVSLLAGITGTAMFALRAAENAALAQRSERLAERKAEEAAAAGAQALANERVARDATARAEASASRARLENHAARLQAASLALLAGEPTKARWHLDNTPVELRGWEHDHLCAQLRNTIRGRLDLQPLVGRQPVIGGSDWWVQVTKVGFSPAGDQIVAELEIGPAPLRDELVTVQWRWPHEPAITFKERLLLPEPGALPVPWFATCAREGDSLQLRSWDGRNTLRRLHGTGGSVTAIALTRDGRGLLTGSSRGILTCWDLGTGQRSWATDPATSRHSAIEGIGITHGGTRVMCWSPDGTISLHQLRDGGLLASHRDGIGREAFEAFASGMRSAPSVVLKSSWTGTEAGLLCAALDEEWTRRMPAEFAALHADANERAISRWGTAVAVATRTGRVAVWRPGHPGPASTLALPRKASGLSLSPDGSVLVRSMDDRRALYVHDASLDTSLRRIEVLQVVDWRPRVVIGTPPRDFVHSMAFDVGDRVLLIDFEDGPRCAFDLEHGRFSLIPRGRALLDIASDSVIDRKELELLAVDPRQRPGSEPEDAASATGRRQPANNSPITAAARIGSANARVVVGHADGSILVLDAASGIPLVSLPGFEDPVAAIDVDSAGRMVAAISERGSLWLFHADTGQANRVASALRLAADARTIDSYLAENFPTAETRMQALSASPGWSPDLVERIGDLIGRRPAQGADQLATTAWSLAVTSGEKERILVVAARFAEAALATSGDLDMAKVARGIAEHHLGDLGAARSSLEHVGNEPIAGNAIRFVAAGYLALTEHALGVLRNPEQLAARLRVGFDGLRQQDQRRWQELMGELDQRLRTGR